MPSQHETSWDDVILPFQLDRAHVRGRILRIDGTLQQILGQHSYPPAVEALLAELVVLTALIGQTVKLRWRLSLQVQGQGAVRMLASDYYAPEKPGEPARLRAYASFDPDKLTGDAPFAQLGSGYFAILIDQGKGTTPYQGITPLDGGGLAQCAETYFAQSEQLPTRFALSLGQSTLSGGQEHWRAGGLMLQMMPAAGGVVTDAPDGRARLLTATDLLDAEEAENWNRVNILTDTVEAIELIGPTVSTPSVLLRLYHEEGPRVFDPQPVRFGCTCSEARVRNSLSIYSQQEIATMTTPEGVVTADCQFCGAHYRLDPATVGQSAPDAAPESAPETAPETAREADLAGQL